MKLVVRREIVVVLIRIIRWVCGGSVGGISGSMVDVGIGI